MLGPVEDGEIFDITWYEITVVPVGGVLIENDLGAILEGENWELDDLLKKGKLGEIFWNRESEPMGRFSLVEVDHYFALRASRGYEIHKFSWVGGGKLVVVWRLGSFVAYALEPVEGEREDADRFEGVAGGDFANRLIEKMKGVTVGFARVANGVDDQLRLSGLEEPFKDITAPGSVVFKADGRGKARLELMIKN